jgi:hypothetical protein
MSRALSKDDYRGNIHLEKKIQVVQGLKRRTTDTIYDIFFTDSKFVAAIVLHPSDLANMYSKHTILTILIGSEYTEREIKARQLELISERRLAYKDKTADEVLTMNKANFEVNYQNVIAVEIRKGLATISLGFMVKGHPETKISFWIERNQITEVEEVVRRFLPNKLKTTV